MRRDLVVLLLQGEERPYQAPREFGYGDVWTWTAIDSDTKLVPSWLVGRRDNKDCLGFLSDLRSRLRPGQRLQLTTDGLNSYLTVINPLFGADRVDYAQIIEDFKQGVPDPDHRYSPGACTGFQKRLVTGTPDPKLLSTGARPPRLWRQGSPGTGPHLRSLVCSTRPPPCVSPAGSLIQTFN